MTYKLYYAGGTAAMGVRVLLEEVGAEYELVETNVKYQTPRSDDLLEHNPNGWVPILVEGDWSMYECAAITIFLCERYPEAKLAPANTDPAWGKFLQYLVYFSSSVQNAFQMSYYPDRFADTPDHEPNVQARAIRRLREVWKVVDDEIDGKEWMLGDTFSAADIYLFMLTTWLYSDIGHPCVEEFENVHRIAMQVQKRASVQTVYGNVYQ
ncbi:MAG: glutathione S-transferase family protein [Pseudomonadota bacterium]